jgi:lysophospholipase L1-like esterase
MGGPKGACYTCRVRLPPLLIFLVALTCSAFAETTLAPRLELTQPALQQGNARVVLVGDSITGQSRNHPAGYAYQLEWALQQAYPGCHPNIISLGGSGQGVQAWLNTEKRSRTENFPLDVKGLDVKTELDQPADVLIVMLGMNDVLAPYVADEPASLAQWAANYRELITALQSRLKPKITAVATPTLCTEDETSPKNAMMRKLNDHLQSLAKELGLRVLPTHDTMLNVLLSGRRRKPDFHVTHDYVHPNEAGHLAIASAMLRGMGEEGAARAIEDQRLTKILNAPGDTTTFSYVKRFTLLTDGAPKRLRAYYFISPPPPALSITPKMKVSVDGWDLASKQKTSPTGELFLGPFVAPPEPHENAVELDIHAGERTFTGTIPISAPWLVATGLIRKPWNEHQTLNNGAFHGPVEEAIEQGRFPRDTPDLAPNQPLHWDAYRASVDYTGGANPDSVDFAAVTHARNFETGYGARWIHSDRDRPVNIELSTQVFAGTMQLGVWLNGASVYSGLITGEPGKKKTVSAQLHAGWNTLVFALNHTTWQMQCTVHLAGIDGDSLDDLRYSITAQ